MPGQTSFETEDERNERKKDEYRELIDEYEKTSSALSVLEKKIEKVEKIAMDETLPDNVKVERIKSLFKKVSRCSG